MTTKTITCKLPEDAFDWEIYNKAFEMHAAIVEMMNSIRQQCKYGKKKSIKFDELREKFFQILNDREIGELF